MVQNAVKDPIAYAASFGYSGTYWDYVQEIAAERGDIQELINLNIIEEEVSALFNQAEFKGYRLDGATQWIIKTMDMVKSL